MKKTSLFNKKKSLHSEGGDVPIPITSLADIFIILLVFLLKGFVSGALNITPSAGLSLPTANADSKSIEALKVEISSKSVLIESKPIIELSGFKFDANGSKTLNAAFETERKKQAFIAKANSDVKLDQKIIVIADQKAPYETIKSVLASAASQGYTDFKLAVINKE